MPAQLTTRAQVNGYRFLLRRLDHALIRRDVRMLHDPMRSQLRSLIVGAILGLLVVAGAAILSFFRPQGAVGDARIVVGKDSGALYVVVPGGDGDDRLHPVLNLASARLVTGSNESPESVKDSKLNSFSRGPLLGIPGAPGALPGSHQGDRSAWTVCESVRLSITGSAVGATGVTTSILAGSPELGTGARTIADDEAFLVREADRAYLIWAGKRAELDPTDSATARTLNLAAHRARPAGPSLLGATTQVPALRAPQIPNAGDPGPGPLEAVPVGGIIGVSGVAEGTELYVVLADGVQPVSPFAAALIRNADSQGMPGIVQVPPDALDQVPIRHPLPVGEFPHDTPRIITAEDAPVACLAWTKQPGTDPALRSATDGPADRATVTLIAGTRLPHPENVAPVALATADGTGDRVDSVYVSPASGEFVQVAGITPGSIRRGSLFYITDSGIRHGIPDAETAAALGLEGTPRLAPWEIVGQLVPGATLSRADALTSHDAVAAPQR
ncbi:type VII secretion protein EccB [Nocardia mangyaensis]|uniref:Type VII secretion protein EccB n=1 Tax=Nocardia mangyaensis TaxID=2213200 RepID=A0A1J0VMN0_9NOCA|nr:type VII secretion protein EccB [Nocardia mangyaensis]APE33270.1 type VII secretion protein EccB [Nocardia mangyaensis]